jgi:hypothetical protein
MLKINKIKYLEDYQIRINFTDGIVKVINFKPLLKGEIYAPLKDLEFFRQVYLDCGTVSWPNGADFAPEYLYKS